MRSFTSNMGDLVQREHPPKLGWNIGCELELNYRGDNVRLLIYVWRREIPRTVVQPKRPAAGYAKGYAHVTRGITGNS